MTFQDWFFPKKLTEIEHGKYTELRADLILSTIVQLEARIGERFPESGLRKVCAEFLVLAKKSESIALQMGKPIRSVRIGAIVIGILLISVGGFALNSVLQKISFNVTGISDLLQATESAINELIFLALALYFLTNIETKLKQQVALKALHRLRSIAHVVDMHQLTKDPSTLLMNNVAADERDTQSSPIRTFTQFELSRYLDYCSELLALVSKTAALFAQNMDDPIILSAVNDVESLTQGLSAKIWQKIMILDLARE
jgi:hypothetical protein